MTAVAEQIRDSDWPERIGRVGIAARGVIYASVALMAFQVASGDQGKEIDRQGALEGVSHQPLGEALLVLLAGGFVAHVAWRVMKAITGASEGRDDEDGSKETGRRILDLGRAAIYVSLTVTTIRVLNRDSDSGSSDERAKSFSAELMSNSLGRWLVIAIGLGLVVTGIVLLVRAGRQKFEEHLDLGEMSTWQRTWLPRLGTVGYGARGVVAALVGAFVVQSGVTFDPHKAEGISGALNRLANRPFGPGLLTAVGLGLLAFGLFSFVEARYRKVLED